MLLCGPGFRNCAPQSNDQLLSLPFALPPEGLTITLLSHKHTMASLAKLTSQSTQTLSLLLERQRLQTLTPATSSNSLHLPQIARNLKQLRAGILSLEERDGPSEAVRLLKSQYERMRGMLGRDAEGAGLESLAPPPQAQLVPAPEVPSTAGSSSATSSSSSLARDTPSPLPPQRHQSHSPSTSDPTGPFAPYTDDPEAGYTDDHDHDPHSTLLTQRQMMDDQDVHLDSLSRSINRQRDLSLQINDELDVHTGLLEGLDTDLDRTETRLGSARRRLNTVAKGAKENGSTMMIGLLILVLLILIIIFKT